MRNHLRAITLWGIGLLAAVLAGCGDEKVSNLAPVTGTVTLQGQPVEGANVSFIPRGGVMGAGITDKAGKFTISTRGQPGAQIGAHNVAVSKKSAPAAAVSTGPAPNTDPSKIPTPEEMEKMKAEAIARNKAVSGEAGAKELLPAKYGSAATSGLEFTVKAGPNDFKIDLAE